MNIHVKILASIYLFLGGLLAVIVVLVHLKLFSSGGFFDNSVTSEGFGISRFFERYVNLLEIYGIGLMSVVTVLLTIISSIGFGLGILRYRKWALYLGFLIAAVGFLGVLTNLMNGSINVVSLSQALLSGYMFRVLLSPEVRAKCDAKTALPVGE